VRDDVVAAAENDDEREKDDETELGRAQRRVHDLSYRQGRRRRSP
jgi:hypothetical protein